ncbi:MAG: GTP-binding protein, partial [Rhodobacteraceae bacterium]|nr:GTP-binding protein [Paracoccaceae bacterium]
EGRKVAVIVNDMSEVNIDADLVREDGALSHLDEKLVEMTNGCICCTLRDDLLVEVRRLAEAGRFDALLIESTGIAEPLPVAATFDFRDEAGQSLSDIARLDTMVTVVDAINLLKDFSSHDFLGDRGESLGPEDERTLVDLLTDQIEFANVIVLNKARDAGEIKVDAARTIIKALNPDATVILADHGVVETGDILETGLFDFDRAQEHPLWAKELYGFEHHTPETDEYGISSFVYRARRPFDPVKIHAVLNGDLPGVIRAKGHFWIATRPDWAAEFSLAGAVSMVRPLGRWWSGVPERFWPTHPGAEAERLRNWQEPWGDRRQEVVFIGTGFDRAKIEARLDACLVEESDFRPDRWVGMRDPFPSWGREAA